MYMSKGPDEHISTLCRIIHRFAGESEQGVLLFLAKASLRVASDVSPAENEQSTKFWADVPAWQYSLHGSRLANNSRHLQRHEAAHEEHCTVATVVGKGCGCRGGLVWQHGRTRYSFCVNSPFKQISGTEWQHRSTSSNTCKWHQSMSSSGIVCYMTYSIGRIPRKAYANIRCRHPHLKMDWRNVGTVIQPAKDTGTVCRHLYVSIVSIVVCVSVRLVSDTA